MTNREIIRHTRQSIFGFWYLLSKVSPNCSLNVIAIGLAVRTPCYRWWIREQADYYGNTLKPPAKHFLAEVRNL